MREVKLGYYGDRCSIPEDATIEITYKIKVLAVGVADDLGWARSSSGLARPASVEKILFVDSISVAWVLDRGCRDRFSLSR